jgi:glucokinase-like ROK family protein
MAEHDQPLFAQLLRGGLIVSCQSSEGDAFHSPALMARFAQAAHDGGAVGIRANGPEDIAAIRAAVPLPVIGIQKRVMEDGRVLITPTLEDARALVAAGATAIALDCTARGQRYGATERVAAIHRELRVPVLADIATESDALAAVDAGVDMVLPTLRGYTEDTRNITSFDRQFLEKLAKSLPVPLIAEGMIHSPEQARQALDSGAWAVVVGTAITRPHEITRAFVRAIRRPPAEDSSLVCIGVDLGGTRTKFGLSSLRGELHWSQSIPTQRRSGRQALLDHLCQVAQRCMQEAARLELKPVAVGLASAGWVNTKLGSVVYATEAMPGWTGTSLETVMHVATGLPVFAENDARAVAVGEHLFGQATQSSDFVCLTLGTGVGGGIYSSGQLVTGAHALGSAIGHLPIITDGLACTCGARGCLERYVNIAALMRYAEPSHFQGAQALIAAANEGQVAAQRAIRKFASYLSMGCAALIHLFDPELIVLAGGLVQDNPLLFEELDEALSSRVFARSTRKTRIVESTLGYEAGILGAVGVAVLGRQRVGMI